MAGKERPMFTYFILGENQAGNLLRLTQQRQTHNQFTFRLVLQVEPMVVHIAWFFSFCCLPGSLNERSFCLSIAVE